MTRFPHWLVVGVGVVSILTGCLPGNRLEQKVSARSEIAFVLWKEQLAEDFTVQERREFNDLLQEIRFDIMANHQASGSAQVEAALRAKLSDHTLAEAVELGFETKFSRLERERASFEKLIAQVSKLRTKREDTASAAYLERRRADHASQLEKNRTEADETGKAYQRWFGATPAALFLPAEVPDEMPVKLPSAKKI